MCVKEFIGLSAFRLEIRGAGGISRLERFRLRGRKSTLKFRVPLKITKLRFLRVRNFFRPKIKTAATMIKNDPEVNKYGGANDQNVIYVNFFSAYSH